MRRWLKRAFMSHLVAAILLTMVGAAAAQGSFAQARELYAAAAYDDALVILNGLRASDVRPEDVGAIDQYRALCLLALGRTDEATRAIRMVVAATPAFHPSETDVSPTVRRAFRSVRQVMLPVIIQQKYDEAKAAFDSKNMAAASEAFKVVVDLLADSDLASTASQPPLSQLRQLAIGFRELTAAAAPPPTAAPVAARRAPPTAVAAPEPDRSTRLVAPRIYSMSDEKVVPPIALRQAMPVLGDVFVQRQGVVEIIINESGLVESATMTAPVNTVYDGLVLSATKSWRYKPATVDGVAVKVRATISLDLKRR